MDFNKNEALGKEIKRLRKLKNMTQKQLAEKLGISDTYISKIEKGKFGLGRGLSEEVIISLVRELGGDEKLYEDLMLVTDKTPYHPILREIALKDRKEYRRLIFRKHPQKKVLISSSKIEKSPLEQVMEFAKKEKG